MTTLWLHDTLSGHKVLFEPREGSDQITLYVCGPTVYNFAHIGNARPVVVFDVLFRLLRRLYPDREVVYARNITDVDDRINAASIEQGVDISVITNRFADIYNQDMAALNARPPTHQPRATAHMAEMVALIERLIADGSAYVSEGEVLFDVARFDGDTGRYGQLAKRSLADMVAGARVEVAENKRHPADFVLWKPSKPGEPVWPGPQGLPGRPGWHIECSAMSEAVLGLPIDIHGGGHDLIFPHHTNEIAQSCAAHGTGDLRAYARYWMHNGFLDMAGEKMSKSLGNVVLVHDLVKTWPGEVIRWALLSGHYRSPLDWTPELLEQSRKQLDYIYGVSQRAKHVPFKEDALTQPIQRNLSSLLSDLNTPLLLRDFMAAAGAVERSLLAGDPDEASLWKSNMADIANVAGFLQQDPDAWFSGGASDDLKAEVEQLIAERDAARQAKNWAEADRIRARLTELNVVVMDGPAGATWRLRE